MCQLHRCQIIWYFNWCESHDGGKGFRGSPFPVCHRQGLWACNSEMSLSQSSSLTSASIPGQGLRYRWIIPCLFPCSSRTLDCISVFLWAARFWPILQRQHTFVLNPYRILAMKRFSAPGSPPSDGFWLVSSQTVEGWQLTLAWYLIRTGMWVGFLSSLQWQLIFTSFDSKVWSGA